MASESIRYNMNTLFVEMSISGVRFFLKSEKITVEVIKFYSYVSLAFESFFSKSINLHKQKLLAKASETYE